MPYSKKIGTKSLNKSVLVLGIILILQILLIINAGINKKGFFVDELWSYGLSNSYYHPHVYSDGAFLEDRYIAPEYFRYYLEVEEDQKFRYDSVFYNQENDNHPPLFYCVLHTICSFFPGTFTKWYGIIPNIIYFVITNIALYFLSKKIFNSENLALLPPIVWGFSIQTVSHVILIRMYVLFSMFVVINSLIHCKYLKEEGDWEKRDLIFLLIINFLGFMTQYYYYIFAFFLSMFTVLMMVIKKQWKQFLIYSFTMLGSVLSAFIVFPGIIKTFKEDRGAEAINNLVVQKNYFIELKYFMQSISDKMLYGISKVYLLVLLVGIVCCIIYGIRNFKKTEGIEIRRTNTIILAFIFAVSCYFLLIVKLAPFAVDRYYFGVTPIFWIVTIYIIIIGWGYIIRKSYITCSFLVIFLTFSIFKGYKDHRIMYQYEIQEDNMKKLQELKNSTCLYITQGREFTVAARALEFQNFSEIKVIDINRISIDESHIHDTSEQMVVYIDEGVNLKEVVSDIMDKTKYNNATFLFRGVGLWVEGNEDVTVYVFN